MFDRTGYSDIRVRNLVQKGEFPQNRILGSWYTYKHNLHNNIRLYVLTATVLIYRSRTYGIVETFLIKTLM